MNHIYRLIWNNKSGTFIAVSELAKSAGQRTSSSTIAKGVRARSALQALAISTILALSPNAYALPVGGVVAAGSASISGGAGSTTITQATPNVSINWQGFSIGKGEAVQFVQPTSSSVALNRVLGSDPSSLLGSLLANGKVFLVNPNGILFAKGASVNVGGLVASTLNITDADFMASTYNFTGDNNSTVINQGTINTNVDGGYVALLGANVNNEGVIAAKLGTVALAAGNAITLDVAGDGLLNVAVNQGAVQTLVENGGLIQAAGGQVLLTARAAGNLLSSVVNNTGVIQAQSIENHNGTIRLMGDMQTGTVNVGGTLDASAPNGGDGGFIETSAAHVKVADNAIVTTRSALDTSGTWLIDPQDFTISATATGTIGGGIPSGDVSGSTLSTALGSGNVTILSDQGSTAGNGDIKVNDAVSWSANMLTLTAVNNINVNAVMTTTGGASLALNPGGTGIVVTGRDSIGNFIGRVDFSGAGTLSIGGTLYTVINSLGTSSGSGTGLDLQGINGSPANLAGHYALGSNIDATATSSGNPSWGGAGFLPIGTFTGTFDGLGHTITGLFINRPVTASVGLFGAVAQGTSTFHNVGLVGGSVTGAAGTGGLIGTSGAGNTVSNSFNTGSVSGAAGTGGLVGANGAGNAISSSYATGSVNGAVGAAGVGGLVGSNGANSPISKSYATGNVTTSAGAASVGGLVGSNGALSTISKSYATGNVNNTGAGAAGIGGLVGSNTTGNVSDSYAWGNISNAGASAAGTGGLMGSNTSGPVHNSYAVGSVTANGTAIGALLGSSNASVVTNSYWNKETSVTQLSAGGGIGMTTADMKKQLDFTSATAANSPDSPTWDFANVWVMYENITYPLLQVFMTPLTVTANNAPVTYSGIAYSGGNGVTYSNTPNLNLLGTVSYGGNSQNAINVGNYVITPSGLYSNQQGYLISYAPGNLTIGQAPLTVTANNQGMTYGGTMPTLTAAYSGFVNGDTSATLTTTPTVASGTAATADAATYNGTITAAGAVDSNYLIGYAPGNLIIGQAPLTVTAVNQGMTYGGTMPTLTAAYSGFVNGDSAATLTSTPTVASGTAATADAATYTGTLVAAGAVDSNYLIGYTPGNLIIGQAPLTVTANNQGMTYGGALPTLTAAYSGFVNGDSAATLSTAPSVASGTAATADAATYNGTITTAGAVDSNYLIGYAPGNLTIGQAPLTVTANNQGMTYGGAMPTLTAAYSGFVNGDSAVSLTTAPSVASGTAATADAATYNGTITTAGAVDSNYLIGYTPGNLIIGQAPLTVTANNQGMTYGGTMPTLTAAYSGFVNGDSSATLTTTPTVASGTAATANAATYTGTLVTAGAVDSNYLIGYTPGNLIIGQAPLTVTANNQGMTYGGTMPNLTATYSGFVNGDSAATLTTTPTVASGTLATADAATYNGTLVAAGAVDSNYLIGYAPGNLIIGQAPLTVTANNQGMTYGGTMPTLTAAYSGFVNGDSAATLTTTQTVASGTAATADAATYTGTLVASGAVDSNYLIGYTPGNLIIGQAPLKVTASDGVKHYGQAPTLSAFTSDGLLNSETIGSVTETSPGTAATASIVGCPYVITPSDATGGTFTPTNYTIDYVNGELFVTHGTLLFTMDFSNGETFDTPGITPFIPSVKISSITLEPPIPVKIVLADPPPQLTSLWPEVVPFAASAVVPIETSTVVPPAAPPEIYVPPQHLRKQDRN